VKGRTQNIQVRNTTAEDFDQIVALSRRVYPDSRPWRHEQLVSHLEVFPEGQWVAVDEPARTVIGMAASLNIRWDDYDITDNWRDFTDHGMFTNHDPETGHTLYGAEIMVDPAMQGRGVGSRIYQARRELAERLGLLRIRSAARLRGYHRFADHMKAESYVVEVVNRRIKDPTLSFQLKHGFDVLAVVPDYLHNDPESLGFAALIEWLNLRVASHEDYAKRDPRYRRPAE